MKKNNKEINFWGESEVEYAIRIAEVWSRKKIEKPPFKEKGDWVAVFRILSGSEFVNYFTNIDKMRFNFLLKLWVKLNGTP